MYSKSGLPPRHPGPPTRKINLKNKGKKGVASGQLVNIGSQKNPLVIKKIRANHLAPAQAPAPAPAPRPSARRPPTPRHPKGVVTTTTTVAPTPPLSPPPSSPTPSDPNYRGGTRKKRRFPKKILYTL